MNHQQLTSTINALFTGNRGLLAMDESTGTANRRFLAAGIDQTAEMRRLYRDLIVTTPGLGNSIGGAILYDETIRQRTNGGLPFAEALVQAGIIPGIKVDMGAKPLAGFPGELVTEGLDGLRERLQEYKGLGARFAKWRAVITIGEDLPTAAAVNANAHALARYAALCQEAGIVPIVEPEVLLDGPHSLERCREVTEFTLRTVFAALTEARVYLEGMILKPNMVLAGSTSSDHPNLEQVAEATVGCFLRTVPAAVPAIAFLSGGQTPAEATGYLNAMNRMYPGLPWILTFSFARAIQDDAMSLWKGRPENVESAQRALAERAAENVMARQGIR